MKKTCLSFVVSIVSVFSVSAQVPSRAENKSAASVNAVEVMRVEPASPTAAETEPVKTPDKDPGTTAAANEKTAPAEEKPAATENVKKPELAELPKPRLVEPETTDGLPIPSSRKPSLEGLSTGNSTIDGYIEEFGALYNIDPLLIYAQMSQESAFKGRATSYKGASGFMQLMPETARRFGVTNIYNPKQNIKAGVRYMRWLLDKFGGDMRLALAGYNAGEGAVVKYGNQIPPYRETQNYVVKIMNHYELLSDQGLTVAKNDD